MLDTRTLIDIILKGSPTELVGKVGSINSILNGIIRVKVEKVINEGRKVSYTLIETIIIETLQAYILDLEDIGNIGIRYNDRKIYYREFLEKGDMRGLTAREEIVESLLFTKSATEKIRKLNSTELSGKLQDILDRLIEEAISNYKFDYFIIFKSSKSHFYIKISKEHWKNFTVESWDKTYTNDEIVTLLTEPLKEVKDMNEEKYVKEVKAVKEAIMQDILVQLKEKETSLKLKDYKLVAYTTEEKEAKKYGEVYKIEEAGHNALNWEKDGEMWNIEYSRLPRTERRDHIRNKLPKEFKDCRTSIVEYLVTISNPYTSPTYLMLMSYVNKVQKDICYEAFLLMKGIQLRVATFIMKTQWRGMNLEKDEFQLKVAIKLFTKYDFKPDVIDFTNPEEPVWKSKDEMVEAIKVFEKEQVLQKKSKTPMDTKNIVATIDTLTLFYCTDINQNTIRKVEIASGAEEEIKNMLPESTERYNRLLDLAERYYGIHQFENLLEKIPKKNDKYKILYLLVHLPEKVLTDLVELAIPMVASKLRV